MLTGKKGSVPFIDIHGMRADEAKRQLEFFLTRTPPSVREVVVIHGYSHGQVLKNMVRHELKHPRIEAKLPSLNEGQTRILLKETPRR
ncbi:MAG TPA: DNA mismatch repair protein MutS [Ruminococcaceae bacterium]|nr:DNA mismatch repair protein MutS [Oscillospiraceae bacterium]